MNKMICSGRLVKDWTTNTAGETFIATNTIAVERYMGKDKEKSTDFIPIKMFGARAKILVQYCLKGQKLLITDGSLRVTQYDDKKSGDKRTWFEILIADFELIEYKKKDSGSDEGWEENYDNSGDIPF